MLMHQLYVFTKVAEERSFSKAAQSIYLSQSTVSTHINNLEKYLGHKLFDRLGKVVKLNCYGEKLYPIAKEMLALKQKAINNVRDYNTRLEGHMRISASTVPAQHILPELISKFSKIHPGSRFTIDKSDSKQVALLLTKGERDLGIVGYKYFSDKLKFIPLMKEKLVVITPPDLYFPNMVSISELTAHPLLFRNKGSGTQAVLEKILHNFNVDIAKLNIVGYFDSVQVLIQCVREGMGISVVSEIAASEFVKHNLINVYELDDFREVRTFYLAYNKNITISPLISEFISYCNKKMLLSI